MKCFRSDQCDCNCVCRLSADFCAFPCLNGGQCVRSESCDCSLYQATGHRCQTGEAHNLHSSKTLLSSVRWPYLSCEILPIFFHPVPNLGFEREMTCRTWGQYNFETFDGLYYYFPGRCTYILLRECKEATQAGIVVQVSADLRLRLHRRFRPPASFWQRKVLSPKTLSSFLRSRGSVPA